MFMDEFNKKNYGSKERDYCTGYIDNVATGKYVLLSHLAAVSIPRKFNLLGLDKINAFDIAEISGSNFGQFNMIVVSSFCGPYGKVAGYDFYKKNPPTPINNLTKKVPVYSADELLSASMNVVGTIDKKIFPILPGSHVPCAAKVHYETMPGKIYAMFAIGIPKNRKIDACILMEDVGRMGENENTQFYLQDLVESVLTVFENQKVSCKEIFTSIRIKEVKDGEIGCAMAFLPYVKLAQNFFKQTNL